MDRALHAAGSRLTHDIYRPVVLARAYVDCCCRHPERAGHPGRSYQIAVKREGDTYVDPETWQAATPRQEGSWWPELTGWLGRHSSGKVTPPAMGAPDEGYPVLGDAPGRYVLQP